MLKRKCDTCGKEADFMEWAVYHHKKARHFCDKKCFLIWVGDYFAEKGTTLYDKRVSIGTIANYKAADVKQTMKEVMKEVNECKVEEHDFQTGEVEFSMTGELIPIEVLQRILDEKVGKKIMEFKDGTNK